MTVHDACVGSVRRRQYEIRLCEGFYSVDTQLQLKERCVTGVHMLCVMQLVTGSRAFVNSFTTEQCQFYNRIVLTGHIRSNEM